MATLPTTKETFEVPSEIFETFLKNLEREGVSAELIERLRKTLLEDKVFTDRALKEAVFPEEPLS